MVCGWYEKIWRVCLFKESHCSPAVLKVPIYYTELVAVIFVWKVSEMHVWNARKHLQPAHSFMLNVLIWKFKSNCSYLLSKVNFLGEWLYTFALAMVILGTVTFSKELLFGSTYSLNFLSGYFSFWEQLLLTGCI